jgi:hypothetical protein
MRHKLRRRRVLVVLLAAHLDHLALLRREDRDERVAATPTTSTAQSNAGISTDRSALVALRLAEQPQVRSTS